jgi:hypothetical protein
MAAMRSIKIRLPESTLHLLRIQARATGRSVADLIRERLESTPSRPAASVYDLTSDLAGRLTGSRRAATSERRRFAPRPT